MPPSTLEEGEDDKSVTLYEMLKIQRTDIKFTSRLEMLKKLIVFTMSLLLREGTYRNALKHHFEANMTKPIAAFFRQKKFRRDFVDTLSKQLALRAKLPHYVVILGHEVD